MIFYTAGRETTFPLQSTLDSKRLSSRQIKKLSALMMYSEWQSLSCLLDVPIFAIIAHYRFGEARMVLSLYNKSRHFSRKKVVDCCIVNIAHRVWKAGSCDKICYCSVSRGNEGASERSSE